MLFAKGGAINFSDDMPVKLFFSSSYDSKKPIIQQIEKFALDNKPMKMWLFSYLK